MYSSFENFLNHTENAVDLPDVQDRYGAISQLFGTDISNCSAIPGEMDVLQTQMSLHGQEVPLFSSAQIPAHVHSLDD